MKIISLLKRGNKLNEAIFLVMMSLFAFDVMVKILKSSNVCD
jgi:hypothetical protein